MKTIERAMLVSAGIALIFSVAAIGMAALVALATPSGTFVVGVGVIVVTGIIGMIGLALFGVLWLVRSTKQA